MNTEYKESIQSLLRDRMRLINNNQGIMNLQKIIPQLENNQNSINKLVEPGSNALNDIINNMSI